MLQPARLLCPWGFSSKNTGVGCRALLQGIFPTQGLSPALHVDSLPTEPPGTPSPPGGGRGSRSVVSDSLQPHGLYLPGSSVHGILGKEYWTGEPFSPPDPAGSAKQILNISDFSRYNLWRKISKPPVTSLRFWIYRQWYIWIRLTNMRNWFPQWLSGKKSTCNAGDAGLNPGSGRLPGGGNGSPLLYSCRGSPMERGVWPATVHGIKESDTTENTHNMRNTSHTCNCRTWGDGNPRRNLDRTRMQDTRLGLVYLGWKKGVLLFQQHLNDAS